MVGREAALVVGVLPAGLVERLQGKRRIGAKLEARGIGRAQRSGGGGQARSGGERVLGALCEFGAEGQHQRAIAVVFGEADGQAVGVEEALCGGSIHRQVKAQTQRLVERGKALAIAGRGGHDLRTHRLERPGVRFFQGLPLGGFKDRVHGNGERRSWRQVVVGRKHEGLRALPAEGALHCRLNGKC